MMEWISVKDRLPEDHVDVLVCGDGWDDMTWYRVMYVDDGKWYFTHDFELSSQQDGIKYWWKPTIPPKD